MKKKIKNNKEGAYTPLQKISEFFQIPLAFFTWQDAQLSQIDRAAAWVSYGQKWKTGTGRQYFTDIIGLYLTTETYLASKEIEIGEKTQNTGYYAVQGHPRSSRSVPIESPYATSY